MNSTGTRTPAISVGMPVFNGESSLAAALDSICQQTFLDFEFIISDNCSTDGTQQICQEYARRDRRIRVIRQEANIGALENFSFVLGEARARYFMWAAADDVRSPDFLEVNHKFLESNPDYVSSTSPVRFEDGDFDSQRMGDSPLTGDVQDRIENFLRPWHANGRFYGLTRTEFLKNCPHLCSDFFGSDWAIVLHLLLRGKIHRHEKGYVVLGRHGISNSGMIFRKYRHSWIHWVIPFFELSRAVICESKNFSVRSRLKIFSDLTALNLEAIWMSARSEVRIAMKSAWNPKGGIRGTP